MNNNKNSNFLFLFAGLFLLVVAVISGACSGGGSGGGNSGGNSARNNSANRTSNSGSAVPNYATAPAGASPAHFKGGQSAKVVIEEFADYECPTCALLHPTVQQLQAAYGDRIKIIFRNFPLQIHPKAYDASVAAEAAGLQGKFWEMQNQIFTNQKFWSTASDHRKTFEDYAQKIGLDVERFRNDVSGMAAKTRVDADMQRARALNVGGTPTFFINGRLLSYEETKDFNLFRQIIEAELQRVQSSGGGGGNQS
ncbi:MAG: DsbA family protein, partial [Acidobacteriota bacterium]|nr:DsbA family protein [Acidobacteriota bacterium]